MNSKLTDFYYTQINPEKGEALAQVKKQHVEILPIFKVNSSDKLRKQAQDKIDGYVGQLLKLNKSENRNQNQLSHIEYEIDKLVYELYGLSEDEVRIIEEVADGNK